VIRAVVMLVVGLSLVAGDALAQSSRVPTPAGRAAVAKQTGLPGGNAGPRVAAPTPTPATKPADPDGKPVEKDKAERDKEDRSQPVTVDSDKMERFGKEGLVIFTGNVIARQNNSVQYADRMEVYMDEKGDRILRTVSTGNIRIITKDCRTGTARRAEYHDLEQRVVLTGGARVWQDDNVVSGETITIYLSQDRSVVQAGPQERVKAVFFPRDQNQKEKKDASAPKTATTACAN
jgi:lipopolysaccharide export system protein LptA